MKIFLKQSGSFQSPPVHKLHQWCGVLVLFEIGFGILVLLGWFFDIGALMQPLPGTVAMNPVTALCFILSALSLGLLYRENKTKLENTIGKVLASLVLALTTLKLVGLFLDVDTQVDSWLFNVKLQTDNFNNISNRIAPQTALGFILTAFALLFIDTSIGKKIMLSQLIALSIGLLGILGILGYLYDVHELYTFRNFFPMAIHTAICFLIITFAILFVHPQKGFMTEFLDYPGRKNNIIILISVTILVPVFVGLFLIMMTQKKYLTLSLSAAIAALCIMTLLLFLLWLSIRDLNRRNTQRNEVEQKLQKNLKETLGYKYALDESAIIAITNKNGIIIHANDNFCNISKYNRDELIGKDHRIINSGYHPKNFIMNLWTTISSGKVWKGEIKNKAKDGTMYWVNTTIVPFLDEHGNPIQYIAIRSDITERKKTEIQLYQVIKDLEMFSYSVAHHLRTPIRAVNGYTEILNEDYGTRLDDEGKRLINTLKNNATQMGRLIDDLLAYSNLGRKEIHRLPVDMLALTIDVLHNLDKSITHHTKFKIGKLHSVAGDYELLHRVMFNLLENAIKYSSKKEIALVEIDSEEMGNDMVFTIKDNGAGFDMQFNDKLFGVFQRLHMTHEFEGTGMGLAIVERIIHKHNGKVWGEGKVNNGATFHFAIPIAYIE